VEFYVQTQMLLLSWLNFRFLFHNSHDILLKFSCSNVRKTGFLEKAGGRDVFQSHLATNYEFSLWRSVALLVQSLFGSRPLYISLKEAH